MFSAAELEIAAQDKHASNTIEQQNLEKFHDQLNAFNTQATLILGFALASLHADNLVALGDDQSKYCIYKSERTTWGYILGVSTVICLSISFTCIASSFYLVVRSQDFALNVGVRPALAMVRIHRSRIIVVFLVGLVCFFTAAVSTVWIFMGTANWRTVVGPLPTGAGSCGANGSVEPDANAGCGEVSRVDFIVRLDDASTRITCLNPHSAADHAEQERITFTFACVVSFALVVCMIGGGAFCYCIKRDFDRLQRALLDRDVSIRRAQPAAAAAEGVVARVE